MLTLLDFDDLSEWEYADYHYASKGVVFGSTSAHKAPAVPHSGQIYLYPRRLDVGPTAYFSAWFQPVRQKRVVLYAGTEGATDSGVFGVLRAFGVNNSEVARDGLRQVQPGTCATRFEVSTAGNQIRRVSLEMYGFTSTGQAFDPDQAIDDLQFEQEPPDFSHFTHLPITTPVEPPPTIDPWWWLHTLTPPGPPPPWVSAFAAALVLANESSRVHGEFRSSVMEIAIKQGFVAREMIEKEAKAAMNGDLGTLR